MLARFLFMFHAAEMLIWLGAARWLVEAAGWSWLASVVAVLAGFFGWRLIVNVLAFVVAEFTTPTRPAAQAVGPLSWLLLVVREAWVFTIAYAWYQLLPARFGREPRDWNSRSQGAPSDSMNAALDAPLDAPHARSPNDRAGSRIVLLVHGYACNGGVWAHYVRWFEAAGWRVHTISLEPIFGTLEDISAALEVRIAAIAREHPGERIDLVCHSMGGLVARAYVARCGRDRLRKIVTLGTPHRGTTLAALGLGANARQMRIGSSWMNDPVNRPDLGDAVAVITYDDNLVSPRENAMLPGSTPIALHGIGHLSLTASRAVFERVLAELSR